MITLEHFKIGNHNGCLTTENNEPLGIAAECYVRGWNKPNYPMPAIPLKTKYFPMEKTNDAALLILYRPYHLFTYFCVAAWWSDGTRD